MRRGLALALLLAGAACVRSVFPGPVHVSTRPDAFAGAEDIGTVSVKQCAVVVLVIPVLDPWDRSQVYDELLTKAEARGGHGVVRYRARGSDLAGFYPFFLRGCVEHRATAVRFVEPARAPRARESP